MGGCGYRAGFGVVAAAVLTGLGLAVSAGAVRAAQGAVRASGSWDEAIGVPGLGALNTGGFAEVESVSCASAGNCAAGGSYTEGLVTSQGFVVSRSG